jgi:hypothetical protein
MSSERTKQSLLRVVASAEVGGDAAEVYHLIADYRFGHQRIVPPQYFRNLRVEKGGYGAGTVISFDTLAFGKTHRVRAQITEPERGRVLVETDVERGSVTTFTVASLGTSRARVTIATELRVRSGVLGTIERVLMSRFLRQVYNAELARIDQQIKSDNASVMQPTIGWPLLERPMDEQPALSPKR